MTASRSCRSTIPLGRLGTPDDIATAVLFMASPAASWITGQHLLNLGKGSRYATDWRYQGQS